MNRRALSTDPYSHTWPPNPGPQSSRKLSGGAHKKLCRTAKQSAVFHPIGLGAAERISFSSRDFERAPIRYQTFWAGPAPLRAKASSWFTSALVMLLVALGGCGQSASPGKDPSPSTASTSAAAGPGAAPQTAEIPASGEEAPQDNAYAASGGITLYFYDEASSDGSYSFMISSPKMEYIVSPGEDGNASQRRVLLHGAEAVISEHEGAGLRIRANKAVFDEAAKVATLSEGVTLESTGAEGIEPLHVILNDIVWNDEDQAASSDHPVEITSGPIQLQAQRFRLFPKGDPDFREGEVLRLYEVQGTIPLESARQPSEPEVPSEAQAAPPESGPGESVSAADQPRIPDFSMGAYDTMQIEKAPEVRMEARRFRSIEGGVEILMTTTGASEEPMRITSDRADFAYAAPTDRMPQSIRLEGNVDIAGPAGAIHSSKADMDLRANRFHFIGGVTGSSPEIERFEANELTYEPGLIILTGRVHVVSPDGTVTANRAELDSAHNIMTFTGNVDMVRTGDTIHADKAVLENAKQIMTFTGSVHGDFADIKGFQAAQIVHHLDTNNTQLSSLRISNYRFGEAPAAAEGKMSFDRMTIERAPDVRVQAGRLKQIKGGVRFSLAASARKEAPTTISADTADFSYAGSGKQPDQVHLSGNVKVNGPIGNLSSTKAEMTTATKTFKFTGGVKGSTPEIPQFSARTLTLLDTQVILDEQVEVIHPRATIHANHMEMDTATNKLIFTGSVVASLPGIEHMTADRITYDPKTEEITLEHSVVKEYQRATTDNYELEEGDIRDWPKLLQALRVAASQEAPSPGKQVLALLPDEVRAGLLRLPPDQTPNASSRKQIRKELNSLLKKDDFYDQAAWAGIALDEALLNGLKNPGSGLLGSDIRRLNRRLFEAAFPGIIVIHPAETP